MLKVSVTETSDGVIFDVEGRLAGPWVSELERCWRDAQAQPGTDRKVAVRLCAVTFIDEAGKDLLTRMFQSGVRLEGAGCLVRAILAEITSERPTRRPVGDQCLEQARREPSATSQSQHLFRPNSETKP